MGCHLSNRVAVVTQPARAPGHGCHATLQLSGMEGDRGDPRVAFVLQFNRS
jgi:hypothetical protein